MKTLDIIQRQQAAGEFDFSRHAFRRSVERNISEQELREAGARAEMIEDYPDDKYSPSALLLGFTLAGRPLAGTDPATSRRLLDEVLSHPEIEHVLPSADRREARQLRKRLAAVGSPSPETKP